jgi:hypothetical protein
VPHPKDKPTVERKVPYVQRSVFAGERFIDRDHAQAHAAEWCTTRAGLRVDGTTQGRPVEVLAQGERPGLLPAPSEPVLSWVKGLVGIADSGFWWTRYTLAVA